MQDEILKKIEEQEQKIDAIYQSVEKTRKYFMWTFIITIVLIVIPLIIIPIILPSAMQGLTGAGIEGL
ncbi:MAG: hypothetical protein Q7S34_02790 [bacterium]|nr:hypothetical protein [bacterium]